MSASDSSHSNGGRVSILDSELSARSQSRLSDFDGRSNASHGQLSIPRHNTASKNGSETERESSDGCYSADTDSSRGSSEFGARVSECDSFEASVSVSSYCSSSNNALSLHKSDPSITSVQSRSLSSFDDELQPNQGPTFITQTCTTSNCISNNETTKESSLVIAVKRGDQAEVRRLLRSGSYHNDMDTNKRTALHIACGLGRLDIVRILIENEFSVECVSLNGQTPLHEACIGGHLGIVSEFLSEAIDLDTTDSNGMSAAHYCSLHGEVSCLSLLCDQGCDICLEDSQGRSGVHLAAMKNHVSIIQCFMERGMELDTTDHKGKTPAHYAAKYGSLKSLQMLVKNAVDMLTGDNAGLLPIHEAAYGGHLNCLKLLAKNSKAQLSLDQKDRSILHCSAMGGSLKSLHWLLEKGLKANQTESEGNTALHYAARAGHVECFACLLRHGASLEIPNLHQETPQDISRQYGKHKAIATAVSMLVQCSLCLTEEVHKQHAAETLPSPMEQKIVQRSKSLFIHPLPMLKTRKKKIPKKTGTPSKAFARNLATKYYGPQI